MPYRIKEIYYTLQGEGAQTGRAAVFCRFAGCNLWSGREADRPTALCRFCDTDFAGTDGPGGGVFQTPRDLAGAVKKKYPAEPSCSEGPTNIKERIQGVRGSRIPLRPLVVCTGGEPLLQLDEPLVSAFHQIGFEIAVETNGTMTPPAGIDWICISPKAGVELRLRSGDELKLIFPQEGLRPEYYESLDFRYFFLQPRDDPQREEHTRQAVHYCLNHPQWRLSLQTHKTLGLP
jgi:7-carboxy-7-deazaguanine synthase